MRSWIGAQSSLGAVVMIVKVCVVSPAARSLHRSHSPASASGRPSAPTIA